MSQQNVELVRLGFEAFNRGGIPAYLERFDPDVVWHTSEDNPDVDTYNGREGLVELAATWREMFDELRVEPYELIDVGDYVIAPSRVRGRGTSSGADIDMPRAYTFKVRSGMVVETWKHRTRHKPSKPLVCRSKTPAPTPLDCFRIARGAVAGSFF
jgi:ketosteroid isomerase-like protein